MTLHPVIFWTLFSLSLVSAGLVFAQGENSEESGVLKMAPIPHHIGRLPPVHEGSLATREQICDKYAKDTVEQLTWLENSDCAYGKDPFSNSQLLISYDVEYSNCMNKYPRRLGEKKFELSEISIKIKERQKAIADCICKPYAYSAIEQNDQNINLECGFNDPRWSSDFSHHYDWCAHGGGNIIDSGSFEVYKADRDNDLKKCQIVKIAKIEPHKSCKNDYKILLDRTDKFWKGDVLLQLLYQKKVLDEEVIPAANNSAIIGVGHLDPDTTDEGKYNWAATVELVAYRKKAQKLFKTIEPNRKIDVQQYARPYLRNLSPKEGKIGTTVQVTLTGATLLRPDKRVDVDVFPSSGGGIDTKVKSRIISTKSVNSSTDKIELELEIAKDAPLGKRSIHIDQCAHWLWSAPFYVVTDKQSPPPPKDPKPPVEPPCTKTCTGDCATSSAQCFFFRRKAGSFCDTSQVFANSLSDAERCAKLDCGNCSLSNITDCVLFAKPCSFNGYLLNNCAATCP